MYVHAECHTYPLLRQLSRTLILAVSQQFDDTTLIGSKAGDFSDDFADESGALALETLSAADARLGCDGGHFLLLDMQLVLDSVRPCE